RMNQNILISQPSGEVQSAGGASGNPAPPVRKQDLQQNQDWGWDAGIRVGWPVAKKWVISSGLSVQRISYEMTAYQSSRGANRQSLQPRLLSTVPVAIETVPSSANRFSSTAALPPTHRNVTLKNQYLSAELPLLLGYRFAPSEKW